VKGEYKPIQVYPLDVFFFIESTQFVYVIVDTLAIFNFGKNIMFQLFKRNLTIVVLVLIKLLGMTFFCAHYKTTLLLLYI